MRRLSRSPTGAVDRTGHLRLIWRVASAAGLVAGFLAATPAQATGINHFEAAAGPHNYVVTNHPAVLPHLTPSAWLLTSYAHDPLVFRDKDGKRVGEPIIEHEVNAELAAALGLFGRFEIGIVAPGLYVQGGGFDGAGLAAFVPGDLRFVGKALLTPWNDGVVASFRLQSDLVPINSLLSQEGDVILAGEKIPNITPAFSVGFNSQYVRLGVDLGVLVRQPTEIDALKVGSEVTYGAGLEVTIVPNTLMFTTDVSGRVAPQFLGSNQDEYPLEANVALKFFTGPIVLLLGSGTGLVPDYGAPDVRGFAAVGFYQRDDDRDKDGIKDDVDKCPDDPEDKDGFEDTDGCPEPDNDKDGIIDAKDKCPNEPEDIDRWQDEDGCPEPDNDGDGIKDDKDECPNDPETQNGFEDEDGCPDEADKKKLVVVKREKIEINDKIFFAYDSDRILPKSYDLLNNVGDVINSHTEIPAIFVEGHTDSDGNDDYNLTLSDRRAKSVRAYLIEHGVSAQRLSAQGFGETKPIASNDNEDGKAQNRRVEFRIVDQGPDPAADEAAGDEAPKKDVKGKKDDGAKKDGGKDGKGRVIGGDKKDEADDLP